MQPLMPPIDSSDNLFHDGNPLTGEKGTIVSADFLNNSQGAIRDQQSELIEILSAAEIEPDAVNSGQLWDALQKLLLLRNNPFSQIKSDKTVSIALTNLGLGDGSAIPVGVPLPWPLAAPPTGWLKCNGASFSATDYPQLAKVYPTLKLLDLRGEFIRGWDDARGVDAGRVLLSAQSDAIRNITGKLVGYDYGFDSTAAWGGAFTYGSKGSNTAASGGTGGEVLTNFDASLVVPTATENRPRNIAMNYIVRAA